MHQRHAKMHAYMLLPTHGERHTFTQLVNKLTVIQHEERQMHKHALNTDQKPKLPLNSQRRWPTEKTRGKKKKTREESDRNGGMWIYTPSNPKVCLHSQK